MSSDYSCIPARPHRPDRTGGVVVREPALFTEDIAFRAKTGSRSKVLAHAKQNNLRFSEALREIFDRGCEAVGAGS